ncbi:hypothetical protein ACS0TY_007884 [Phlomoides rotata]
MFSFTLPLSYFVGGRRISLRWLPCVVAAVSSRDLLNNVLKMSWALFLDRINGLLDLIKKRSSQTVSTHFHAVLQCVLKFHNLFFVKPQSVADDCSDPHWGKFKGCLGALDGTYIDVHVPTTDKGRYRNRKGTISINVLGVYDMDMKFAYVLTGWEGSATNSRVLRDAINRVNGLKVPKGNYYLCDNGYPNCVKSVSKGDPDVTRLIDSLGEFIRHSNASIDDLTKGIDSNSGQANDNKQLNNIMSRIAGLKMPDKLKVCDELVQNEKRLEFFFSLPEDEQEKYVCMLLDGRL